MDITLDDIAQLALELWFAKRDAGRLAAENADLRRQLHEAAQPADIPGE